jgi:hypothetical protein
MGAAVAQAVQCLTTGWTIGVRSPTEAADISSSFCVQTGSGAHPASYPMGTGGPFPGGKARYSDSIIMHFFPSCFLLLVAVMIRFTEVWTSSKKIPVIWCSIAERQDG